MGGLTCVECGESESSNPAFSGLHRYGPTGHDFAAERTTYLIVGSVVGSYWWPIGEQWTKPLQRSWFASEVEDLTRLHDYGSTRSQRLRALLDDATARDGDSATALRLSADSVLIVERESKRGGTTVIRQRAFPLSMFPSARDYWEVN